GGSATFNYTVVATELGFVDSGWQVTGTIVVTNPNTFEAISASLADGNCAITGGASTFSVAASSSVSRTYLCTFGSNPNAGTNTAKIVETGQTASASVQVCGPIQTGALTIGFWQNKNGQAIITGGASTGLVCNSGTWLRQFPPFQDLSATATCAQVAAYFTAVF